MRRFIEEPPRTPPGEGNETTGYSPGYFERLRVMHSYSEKP